MNMRIDKQTGEWLEREKKISFTFEGEQFTGFEGDTITSALWASGEKVLGRSFKYHRARGVLSLANHDINVMLTDGEDTNIRGDVVAVKDGMSLMVINTMGGVKKDNLRFIEKLLSPFLVVGFYYKAFFRPRFMFPFWENIIRHGAGLGKVNFNYPRIPKPKLNAHYDVLVVGAGPAGLAAALAASLDRQLKILLVDENKNAGGSLGYDRAGSNELQVQLEELLEEINKAENITLRTNAYAAAYYADHLIPIVEEAGITKVRTKTLIVATGAFEQPPVFRNNDLPGVMNGSAAQRMIYRYGIKPFDNGVVFTANNYGYRVALDLIQAGTVVKAVVDLRKDNVSNSLSTELLNKGVNIYVGCCVYEAIETADNMSVKGVVICPFDEDNNKTEPEKSFTVECDGVAMSAGWASAAALLYQSGMKVKYDNAIEQFIPESLPKGIFSAGKVNGIYDLEQRIADGARAASEAMRYMGRDDMPEIPVQAHRTESPSHQYPIVPHPKGRNFVDFDEDIQAKDFINAAKEGFDNIELMKRYTTVGMGPSQGKHSNMNAIRILANIRSLPVEKIGSTTSRPFFHPTPIGHLGGRSFHPKRQSSIQQWHKDSGAVFVDVGAWSRPAYYAKAGEDQVNLIQQEAMAVHHGVGIIDGSSLGKIEVCGPDAAQFLELFFTDRFTDQKVGETRYALSIDESAVISDDGIVSRISAKLFYITVGTSNAAMVYREMQRWLQIWQLDVGLINVTGSYGIINIVGPKSPEVMLGLTTQLKAVSNLDTGRVCEIKISGVLVRVMRVTFVAEIGYEIHVPANNMLTIWNQIIEIGSAYSIRPFGTDTQRLLRLEMGHHLPGYDTDGLTTPFELGCDSALAMDKSFFIGQRSLQILAKKCLSKRLVPFMLADGFSGQMPEDCNLVIEGSEIKGRVTSISFSRKVNRVIGFAYVDPNKVEAGSEFKIKTDNGSMVKATVVKTPFFKSNKEL
ncbi:MAG: aminomethyltransferase [Gammaproteobacteria bacterium]|nr:MAG: aminomethyltransferase [Gammaproteobacteria bacterium]